MAMYNRTVLIGRLGEAPELKPHPKAEFQTEFYISNSTIVDGKEVANWHKIVAFGKQARLCSDHLHKGDLCCIEGRLDIDTRTEPFKQYIAAERITFLSSFDTGLWTPQVNCGLFIAAWILGVIGLCV